MLCSPTFLKVTSLKYDVAINLRAALWSTGEPELPTWRGLGAQQSEQTGKVMRTFKWEK